MPEQITFYQDELKLSPFCHRVEVALLEAGATYTSHGFDLYNKPAWFARANPLTGKIPVIAYGGPDVSPEEPSPLSSKITESYVILEFLADLFPNSTLLPPASNPTARARVRFFIDVVKRDVEAPLLDINRGVPGAHEKLVQGLAKIQSLLPDPEAADGGEYAMGKDFTNADCAIVPLLAALDAVVKMEYENAELGDTKQFGEMMAGAKFERLIRYKKALWERESVKKVLDLVSYPFRW
ncbi:hypothetical protein V8E55_006777 [Tylopilus felleus]